MTSPSRLAERLRSARPALGLALAVGVASIVLTVAVARQLGGIGQDAGAFAERWIARAATLDDFEETLRGFRQGEARHALTPPSPERDSAAQALDRAIAAGDSLLAAVAGTGVPDEPEPALDTLRARWGGYVARHRAERPLAGGIDGAAIAAFRAREPAYTAVVDAGRRVGDGLRSGARRVVSRSRRTTIVSAALLAGSAVLTIAALALAELVRRSARARSEAERRWRGITEQPLGLVWEVGGDGRIRYASAATLAMLGRPAEAVLGERLVPLVHPDDRRAVARAVRTAVAERAPLRDLELRVLRPDGSVAWLAVTGQLLGRAAGRPSGIRGLAVDITRRMQAEQALGQGRRLEALGTLAGGVAHDLNNVLAAITGYAQLARMTGGASAAVLDDLLAIEQAADRGTTLVRRILQFARRQPTERTPVRVRTIVDEVVALLRPQLPPQVTIEVAGDARDAEVLADAAELHQAVVNVATNAVHAMRRRGGVLRIALAADAREVRLVIDDEGEGMAPAVLERALEPFFTTRGVGEGTGMGLAVVHGVVHALGGTLALDSRPGAGTSVRITLPRHVAPSVAAPAAPAPVSGGTSRRVLLVDDDDLVARTLARTLERAGHVVECHAEAATALDALRAVPARADVIVTDLTMPGMTGLDLVRAMRETGVTAPVVLCSGYLDELTALEARLLGVVRLLDKPVPPATLLDAVAHPETGGGVAA